MLVKDIMVKNPITIAPEASVLEAKDLMTKNGINKLPVLDKNGALVGIITRNDLMKSSPSDATTLDMFELGYLLSKLTVEKTMSRSVKTVCESDTVEEAARLMSDYSVGCLPVLRGNILVGIVTESDVFASFIRMFNTRASGVRATVIMTEEPGQLAKFTAAIADKGGNIVSIVSSDVDSTNHRMVTVKAASIGIDDFKKIITDCGAAVDDIRNV